MGGTIKEVDTKQKEVKDENKIVKIITGLIVERKNEDSVDKAETKNDDQTNTEDSNEINEQEFVCERVKEVKENE